MDCNVLMGIKMRNTAIHNKSGYSLLELSIAVFLMLLLFGIIPVAQGRILAARGARTIIEMQAVLDSAKRFYIQNNRWPADTDELKTFLPDYSIKNVFGNDYNLVPNGAIYSINTIVPYKSVNVIKNGRFVVISDTGSANLIQLSTTIPMGNKIGRLQYEKTWIQ